MACSKTLATKAVDLGEVRRQQGRPGRPRQRVVGELRVAVQRRPVKLRLRHRFGDGAVDAVASTVPVAGRHP